MKTADFVKGNETFLLKLGAVAAIGIFVVVPLLKTVGFIKSKDDKEKDKEEKQKDALLDEYGNSEDSPFNPQYYKSAKAGAALITKNDAKVYAKKLWDAKSVLGDDEDAVSGVFRQLKAKTQVSFLSEVFNGVYGRDLYAYLRSFLNNDEMYDHVNSIVSRLS